MMVGRLQKGGYQSVDWYYTTVERRKFESRCGVEMRMPNLVRVHNKKDRLFE